MKTIKVIDLLNRCLVRDETLPKYIEYDGDIFEREYNDYREGNYFYTNKASENLIERINIVSALNEAVEIVEEKEIEQFTETELEVYHDMEAPIDDLAHKVSLLIDAVNEMRANNE